MTMFCLVQRILNERCEGFVDKRVAPLTGCKERRLFAHAPCLAPWNDDKVRSRVPGLTYQSVCIRVFGDDSDATRSRKVVQRGKRVECFDDWVTTGIALDL